jgi:hypothetical protein
MRRGIDVAETLKLLGQEAQDAYCSTEDKEWEHVPEDAMCGHMHPVKSDDGSWYEITYCEGWRVETGHLFSVAHRFLDGDWDVTDLCDVSKEEYLQFSKEYFDESESVGCYMQYVYEHGEDPLGYFHIRRNILPKSERWCVWVTGTEEGVRVVKSRRSGRVQVAPGDIPKHVRSYLGMTTDDYLLDFKTIEELDDAACDDAKTKFVKPNILRIEFCCDAPGKPRSEKAIKRELRKLAIEICRTSEST